jgi:hypothetical protein
MRAVPRARPLASPTLHLKALEVNPKIKRNSQEEPQPEGEKGERGEQTGEETAKRKLFFREK